MNFHWPFARKPEHSPLPDRSPKGQFIVSPKTRERMSRATEIRCQLRDYKATTTPEQRLADYEAWRGDQAGAFKIWSTGSATTTHIEADGRRIPWSQGRGAVIYLTEREALQAARLAKTIEYAADLARLDALIAALDDEQPRD